MKRICVQIVASLETEDEMRIKVSGVGVMHVEWTERCVRSIKPPLVGLKRVLPNRRIRNHEACMSQCFASCCTIGVPRVF